MKSGVNFVLNYKPILTPRELSRGVKIRLLLIFLRSVLNSRTIRSYVLFYEVC